MTFKEMWNKKLAEQEAKIAKARMPTSMDDAQNLDEFMAYSRVHPNDPILFIQTPEDQESSLQGER